MNEFICFAVWFVIMAVLLHYAKDFMDASDKKRFGSNVVYYGSSVKIKDEAALLKKAEMELKILNAQLGGERLHIVRSWDVIGNEVIEIPLSLEELIRDGQTFNVNMIDMGLIFWNHLREERGLEPISKTAIAGEQV